ncbi:TRAP transporter large permease [Crenalkalicoccus roseus]|uniref:TRAP transporter large permease n=1 Tax=Crenalkalicoccus roseus TaxID=1485588 RepID=UPI00195CAFBC|nr:TRAP transporter large permease subunit [Crenalkalicoccus roseus]
MLGLALVGTLIFAIFIGFPIAFTLIILAFTFGYIGFGPVVVPLMITQAYGMMQEEVLAAAPLFIFMGFLMERAGLIVRLFHAFRVLMGAVRGSLYLVVLLTCTVFATATGIIGASVTVIGLLAVPIMLRCGYDPRLTAGVITAGGCLGILIPPSLMLVLLGPVTGVSVIHLFAGAIIPGLMLSAMHIIYAMARSYFQPHLGPPLPPDERATSILEPLRELAIGIVPAALLMFAALGTILAGLATPTEASAMGAAGALLLGLAYRSLTWEGFKDAVYRTATTSSMILFLALSANMYAAVFGRLGTGAWITEQLLALPLPPMGMMILIQVLIFLLAWPLEWPAIILIFVPILLPVVTELGFDMLWFSILVAVNLQSAFLSPPVAMAAYYLKGAAPQLDMKDIFIGMLQFNVIQNLAVVLLLIFPGLALWLPRVLYD